MKKRGEVTSGRYSSEKTNMVFHAPLQHLEMKESEKLILGTPTPLPWRELFFISVIQGGQALQTTMLLPIFVFMVKHYGVSGDDEHSVGKYAGFMAALYSLGQFCTSMLWGSISDRTGRKGWLIWGNLVTAVSALLLGLAESYWLACLVQLLNGLLNCTQFLTASTLAGFCDMTNQAQGFAVLNFAWGVGSMIGSLLGGLLAQPCQLYSLEYCPQILHDHPFFPPFALTAVYALGAAVCSAMLRDPSKVARRGRSETHFDTELHLEQVQSFLMEAGERSPTCKRSLLSPGVRSPLAAGFSGIEVARELLDVTKGGSVEGSSFDQALPGHPASNPTELRIPSISMLLQDRDITLIVLTFAMTAFIFTYGEELFPIFAAAPVSVGGLGLTAAHLGVQLGLAGGVIIVYTLLAFPYVARRMGPLWCLQYAILVAAPLYMATPVCSVLLATPWLEWALLLTTVVGRAIVVGTGFTSGIVLLTNSAPPGAVGMVTGLGHSISNLFKAVAPAIGGLLWSLTSHSMLPLHQFLPWVFVTAVIAVASISSRKLSPTLNAPRIGPILRSRAF